MKNLSDKAPLSYLLLYQTEDGRMRIQVRLEDETVWLTQADMAQLFKTTPQNITNHLNTIFQEGESEETATCKVFIKVQTEGGRSVQRTRRRYYLDDIISVGYWIKSDVAKGFQQAGKQRSRFQKHCIISTGDKVLNKSDGRNKE